MAWLVIQIFGSTFHKISDCQKKSMCTKEGKNKTSYSELHNGLIKDNILKSNLLKARIYENIKPVLQLCKTGFVNFFFTVKKTSNFSPWTSFRPIAIVSRLHSEIKGNYYNKFQICRYGIRLMNYYTSIIWC